MQGDRAFDLVGRKEKEPGQASSWPPSERPRHAKRLALVPGDLALDGADVVEPCLYFDEDQGSGARIECQEVDPTVCPASDDLQLAGGRPPMPLQPAVDVRGATGVDQVTASRFQGERWPAHQVQVEPEPIGDPPHEIQGWVDPSGFDACDVRARDADRRG